MTNDVRLADTHCHLQAGAFDEDRDTVRARALERLEWIVVIGDDIESSQAGLELTGPGVYAAVGVHPYHAAHVTSKSLETLEEMAASPQVVALGEMGLDYFKYNDTPPDVQAEGFRRQLELAVELELPVVIHNRESQDDIIAILDEYAGRLAGGIMHCFSGDTRLVERCVKWGFHVSFAGNVTFPKAGAVREAAAATPIDLLLVETDSPYLAPQPKRGKRCEPAYVRYTAETLAEVKGVSLEELGERATANAERLFRVNNGADRRD
ncbi:MAG: TatD family hydrolase [Candidatus Hydrogenedentota bacterium]